MLDMYVEICIDNFCDVAVIISELSVPMPVCNMNGTLPLPGDGTFQGVFNQLIDEASLTGVNVVSDSLGIKVMLFVAF